MARKEKAEVSAAADTNVIGAIVRKINAGRNDGDGYHVLSADNVECHDFISTGNFAINHAISGRPITGGFPVGKVSEVFGEEASGKTLLSTMCMIETQRRGGIAILLDTEHSFYPDFFVAQGGNLDKIIQGEPETLEKVWDEMEKLVEIAREICPDKYVTIVWDSVTTSSPKREMEGEMAESEMGERAKLNSKGLRKLVPKLAKNKITLICINQVRDKIGVMFGNPETTPGGRGWRFHASCRIRTAKRKSSLDRRKAIASRMVLVKNKVYLPWSEAEYVIDYNRGVNPASGFMQCLKENELLERSGSYYNVVGCEDAFQKKNAVSYFKSLLDSNFKGVEKILGKDVDRIGTPEFNANMEHMKQKLALFSDADSDMEENGESEKKRED